MRMVDGTHRSKEQLQEAASCRNVLGVFEYIRHNGQSQIEPVSAHNLDIQMSLYVQDINREIELREGYGRACERKSSYSIVGSDLQAMLS